MSKVARPAVASAAPALEPELQRHEPEAVTGEKHRHEDQGGATVHRSLGRDVTRRVARTGRDPEPGPARQDAA